MRIMASPTAASAAATAMTKKTINCPSIDPQWRARATNDKFTAFNINSTDIKMMMVFRRNSTPIVPIVKRTALRMR